MGKRKCSSDSAYIKEHIRQGFGQGRGADYKPWLGVRDVPSTGVSSRVKGWTTSRVHEFFSQLELRYFYRGSLSERRATLKAPRLILGTDDYRMKVALLSRQNALPSRLVNGS